VKLYLAGFALIAASQVYGQEVAPAPSPITYEQLMSLPLPVTASDIKGKAYEVIGNVEAKVRKATVFSPAPSQEKVYKELWERAVKLRADAVINATYGESKISLLSWGQRKAVGTAIRFVNVDGAKMQSTNPW
jgi:uncharacterized protein YbjQ (UPF0145 family)